jgi:hypothetical protein
MKSKEGNLQEVASNFLHPTNNPPNSIHSPNFVTNSLSFNSANQTPQLYRKTKDSNADQETKGKRFPFSLDFPNHLLLNFSPETQTTKPQFSALFPLSPDTKLPSFPHVPSFSLISLIINQTKLRMPGKYVLYLYNNTQKVFQLFIVVFPPHRSRLLFVLELCKFSTPPLCECRSLSGGYFCDKRKKREQKL